MFTSTETICNHTFLPRFINSESLVLDLGANHGEFAHCIIERFGCRVVSAEPVRELFDQIRPHPLLDLHAVALGGKSKEAIINVYSERCASIAGPTTTTEPFVARAVPMITLAEFRRLALIEHIELLKIDIEGAEIELFNACSDDELRDIRQITIEFHDFVYEDQRKFVLQAKARLADIGFWVLPFSLDNTNVLFLNRSTGVSRVEIAYLRTISKYGQGIARRVMGSARGLGLIAGRR